MTLLHTAVLNGQPVRFFRSPLPEPDFPWCAMTDLFAVCEFPPEGIAHWTAQWQEHYPDRTRVLDGVVIVPGYAGKGLFEYAQQQGWERATDLHEQFCDIEGELFCVLYAASAGTEEGFRTLVQQAILRDMIVKGAHVH